MQKTLLLSIAFLLTVFCNAQRRYKPENLTDYSKLSSRHTSPHKHVGSAATAPLRCIGSPKVPVLLVQFSDMQFTSDVIIDKNIKHSDVTVNQFYNLFCNGSNTTVEEKDYMQLIGSVSPVKDYFTYQSDGLFQPDFEVIGPVTLPKSYAYYGRDNSDYSRDVNINEFFNESIKLASKIGVDWTIFDNDKNGVVDFVFFIYAGEGQNSYGTFSQIDDFNDQYPNDPIDREKAHLIWPKEVMSQTTIGDFVFAGYGCTNEIYDNMPDGIGTMCHELSHGLGLPDFYDYRYIAYGLDHLDIMDSGDYIYDGKFPCAYSTYERDFMGWRALETLHADESLTLTLLPVEQGGKGYKILNPLSADEYFILENRQPLHYDTYLGWRYIEDKDKYGAIAGLMVSHVDYSSYAWNSNSVNSQTLQHYTILPADDELISSITYGFTPKYLYSMAGDLYPGIKEVTSIPSSKFACYTGNTLPVSITKIQQNDDFSVTLQINGGGASSVENVLEENNVIPHSSAIYDLTGRQVNNPKRGFYVQGGKKYFIK